MASEYRERLGARLRKARTQQGLSLAAVEEKSGGQWKAVVVGAYERADRGVTAERLVALAGFYGIPVTSLLPDACAPDGDRAEVGHLTRVVTDAGIRSVAQAQRVALAVLGDGYARTGGAA
jgi:transcriptional regulator with XRE-family HTH domain